MFSAQCAGKTKAKPGPSQSEAKQPIHSYIFEVHSVRTHLKGNGINPMSVVNFELQRKVGNWVKLASQEGLTAKLNYSGIATTEEG